jgi:hypothetical protein
MQQLIKQSMNDLGSKGQNQLVGDIFQIYFTEHVLKASDSASVEDDFLLEIC